MKEHLLQTFLAIIRKCSEKRICYFCEWYDHCCFLQLIFEDLLETANYRLLEEIADFCQIKFWMALDKISKIRYNYKWNEEQRDLPAGKEKEEGRDEA